MESDSVKKYIAEAFGTMVLTFVGCGTAVITGGSIIVTALAFGFSVIAMAYCIGRVSGCHINPAITIGMLIDGRMEKKDASFYILAQFIGGIIGAFLLWFIVGQCDVPYLSLDDCGLGVNGYGDLSATNISMIGALVVEILLTMFFVLAALGVTSTRATAAQGGIVIGIALVLVHLIGIGLTGTSVNPARSLGPAIFRAFHDTLALQQVWLFIIAPIIGAVLAAYLWRYLRPADSE